MAKKVIKAKKKPKKAGRKVGDPIPVSIKSAEEHWNIYKLSDGTTVRARPILIEIARQHDKFDDKGSPIYTITGGVIQELTVPKRLRKK
ncbi:MAG: hypothetical protein HQ512_02255 [Rhodospirillales bacterium]|nr:hypothetical protein [Rhodospirillales bacterium]